MAAVDPPPPRAEVDPMPAGRRRAVVQQQQQQQQQGTGPLRGAAEVESPFEGRQHSQLREVSELERRKIRAARIGDSYFNPLFYAGSDADDEGGGGGGGVAVERARTAESDAVAAEVKQQLVQERRRRRHHTAPALDERALSGTAYTARRRAVLATSVHFADISALDARVLIADSTEWRPVNAELACAYAGARMFNGGMVELVWTLASAGAYLVRKRHPSSSRGGPAPCSTPSQPREGATADGAGVPHGGASTAVPAPPPLLLQGSRFDDPAVLLAWACAGTYRCVSGQTAEVYTFSIDTRIDLGVSVAVAREPAPAGAARVCVLAYAYWCLLNPLSKLLERHAHTPPALSLSLALRHQLWELPRVRWGASAAAAADGTLSLVPGWQRSTVRSVVTSATDGDASAAVGRSHVAIVVPHGGV